MLANSYQKYQQSAVMTAAPGELTLMLYNGAIKFCNQGIDAIENKNTPAAHTAIIKAQNIIDELRLTLNPKYEVTKEMNLLYVYIGELLMDANLNKDIAKLEEAKMFITEFRDLWKEVMKKAK